MTSTLPLGLKMRLKIKAAPQKRLFRAASKVLLFALGAGGPGFESLHSDHLKIEEIRDCKSFCGFPLFCRMLTARENCSNDRPEFEVIFEVNFRFRVKFEVKFFQKTS